VDGTLPQWDLSGLYASPDDPAIQRDLDDARARADAFGRAHEGSVGALDGDALAALLGAYESLLTAIYRPQLYAQLVSATATLDEAVRAMAARVGEDSTASLNRVRFVDLELGRADAATHARWDAHPALARYRHHLARARAAAPHALPTEVEGALATKDLTGRRAWSQLYNELCAGWRFTLRSRPDASFNLAEVRSLREDADRGTRAEAHAAVLERLEREAQVIAFVVNTLYQDHRLETDLRRYDHPVAPTLLDDELPRATLDALMTAVEAHYPVAQRYFSLKARALGLERLGTHDVLAPYPDGERPATFAEARAEVLASFEALSPRARELADAFFTEARVDAAPRPGKRDGAFCAGMVPGVAPRVLVNFNGRLRDVFTLAHELGHGVHFALAGERQSLLNYWPTSPMAETASVFGEMLLTRRLLGTVTDKNARRQLLAARIEEALGTIHRQVAFTRYERNAHDERARAVLSTERLCALWSAETARLYGDAVARTARDAWGWAGIPHLIHYRFYCYSYAFGQLLVFALYDHWERGGDSFVPKYLELLAGGGGATPQDLLRPLGIDLTDPEFWRRGLDVVTRMVDEFAAAV
jgi:oligoendopeptidase F